MPHHSGGDNATKVRCRSTCRNSFRDIFLYDPFAHLKHALRFHVLPKNTRKKTKPTQFGFRAFCTSSPQLWNVLPQTIREADSSATSRRRLKTHLFSDFLFQYLLDSLCTVTFLGLPETFFCFYLVFLLKKKIFFRALSIQVNGPKR